MSKTIKAPENSANIFTVGEESFSYPNNGSMKNADTRLLVEIKNRFDYLIAQYKAGKISQDTLRMVHDAIVQKYRDNVDETIIDTVFESMMLDK